MGNRVSTSEVGYRKRCRKDGARQVIKHIYLLTKSYSPTNLIEK